MKSKKKEKERQDALKALRQELAEEIAEQLPAQMREDRPRPEKTSVQVPGIEDDTEAKRVIEAILFTASKPVTVPDLKRALSGMGASKIDQFVRELQSEYEREGRSFRIREIAGGFECATDPKYAPWIMKLELQKRAKNATQSALETLAILAYKQPVTRAEVEDLRGVDVSGVLNTLLEKNLIKIVGRKEVPGRPFLYGTTDRFLQHFGLKSLEDLPNISEIKALVENSVKREELLKTEKMVSAEEGQTHSEADTRGEAAKQEDTDDVIARSPEGATKHRGAVSQSD